MSRRSDRSRRTRPGLSRPVAAVLGGLALVLFAGGIYLGVRMAQPDAQKTPPPPEPVEPRGADAGAAGTPPYAGIDSAPDGVFPPRSPQGDADWDPDEILRWQGPERGEQPVIALIIDDLGRSLRDVEALGQLGIPISYSVLPFETKTRQVVRRLRKRQEEILLHLPMEAKGGNNPGPGAVLLAMTPEEMAEATRQAIAAVPGVVGSNNHMGSGISADREALRSVLEVLRQEKLFYVDSRTAPDTLGFTVARHLGLPAAERQVFLDTEIDRDWARRQFKILLQTAESRGAAIAIGHPYEETLDVLAEEVPKALEAGFRFVPVSTLLDH